MKKTVFLLIMPVLILLNSGCATVPKPSSDVQTSAITFYFFAKDHSALTFWRKINDDGSKGKRFSVGGSSKASLFMNSGFSKPFEQTVNLEPGTYYLDSFQIVVKEGFLVSQNKHFAMRNGWDDTNKKPLYLSFTIEEGKDLILPQIEIIPVLEEGKYKSINGYTVVKFQTENQTDMDIFNFGSMVEQEEQEQPAEN